MILRRSTRQTIIVALALATLAFPKRATAGTDAFAAQQRDTVRLAVFVAGDSTSVGNFTRGVELGITEATALAKLLGRPVESSIFGVADSAVIDALVAGRDGAVSAVVSFLDSAGTTMLARRLERESIALINSGSRSDALRRGTCSRMLFHVAPSDAMLRDAAVQAEAGEGQASAIVAWDGKLERFGAGELNDRYRARFGVDATQEAWLGWISIKIAAEAALRAPSTRGPDVLFYLSSTAPRFDGHKGKPLTFRPWDLQLRQPLYAIVQAPDGHRTIEIPRDDSAGEATAAARLDQLGDGPGKTACGGRS